jgi:hypothetical protein
MSRRGLYIFHSEHVQVSSVKLKTVSSLAPDFVGSKRGIEWWNANAEDRELRPAIRAMRKVGDKIGEIDD